MSRPPVISIQIDGQALQVERGLTILEAARQSGIDIPTLCDFPGLPAHGSCRMCIVEIAGRENTPTACTTPVEAGMVVLTHSPRVVALRKELIQLLLAEHPSGCLFCPEKDHCEECMVTLRKAGVTTGCGSCPKDSQCELQALAQKYEVRQPGYPIRYRMLPVENRDPFFDRDPNLCILCGRCIRVCQEQHFTNTLTYKGRGAQALVSTAFERLHLETSCSFCGSCVEVCPTGAITEKTRKWDGKPERVTASTCPLCSIGCQIQLLSKQERVIGSLPNHQAGTAALCVNGRFGITELVDPTNRLKHPQHLAGEGWQTAGWEEAAQTAVETLRACSPERFEMRVSAWLSNEDLFVARQFAGAVMKSSPVLASVRQRYGSALGAIARLMRASAPLDALMDASDVFCIGVDDPYAQSVVAVELKKARQRGAKVFHLSAGEIGDARLLAHCNAPVILLGAPALAGPENAALLARIETLVAGLKVQVVAIPEESNLAGALRLGLAGSSKPSGAEPGGLGVLVLIGEPLPEKQNGAFIIAHQMALPDGPAFNGLLFPAAAFSEQAGTLIDCGGRMRVFHPAVAAPGEALPAWKMLTLLARQMGAQGFDYTCVEDIWQAAQAEYAGFPAQHAGPASALPEVDVTIPGGGWREPVYLGQPLARRVAGLRSLYPVSSDGRGHE